MLQCSTFNNLAIESENNRQVITEIYKYNNDKIIIHYVDNILIEVNIFRSIDLYDVFTCDINTASFFDNVFKSNINEVQTVTEMKCFAKMLKTNKHKYLQSSAAQTMLSHMLSIFRN